MSNLESNSENNQDSHSNGEDHSQNAEQQLDANTVLPHDMKFTKLEMP